ncbi:hypothetical protein GCM10028798_34100 [Humibacter antri]
MVTLAAVVRLIAQIGQNPSRADRDLDIFLQVFVAAVIVLAAVMVAASSIVWSACRKVRRLRPDDVVFAAMVGMPFIQAVSQLASSAGGAAMPKYLWRPIVSVNATGITVWYRWLRPRPGLVLPVHEVASVREVIIRNPGIGGARVSGVRLTLTNPSHGTLDFTVSRATPLASAVETESSLHDLVGRVATRLHPLG